MTAESLIVVIHGRPVSWNRAYRYGRDKGNAEGKSRMFMTREANTWKELVWATALDAYNKSQWRPGKGQLIVEWRLWLTDVIDADNCMKLVHDGLAKALGINDKRFLPRVMEMTPGMGHDTVSLTISNAEPR